MNITAQAAIQQIMDTLYAPVRYTGTGSPEGSVTSEPGWFYRDTNSGLLWFKKTGSAATGWKVVGGVLVSNYTTAGNTSAAAVALQTDNLPAGVLAVNGDSLVCRYSGQIVGSNVAVILLRLAGNTVATHTLVVGSTAYYTVESQVFRTGSTTARVVTKIFISIEGSAAVTTYTWVTDVSSLDFTSSVAVVLEADPTSSTPNNVTKFTGFIELKPSP